MSAHSLPTSFYITFRHPRDALKKPFFQFRVDVLNVTLTLGYVEDDYFLGVDKTLFRGLPIAQDVPEIAHSVVEEHKGSIIVRIDFNLFLKGHRKPISLEHNLRSEFATLDIAGMKMKSWQVKKLIDAF